MKKHRHRLDPCPLGIVGTALTPELGSSAVSTHFRTPAAGNAWSRALHAVAWRSGVGRHRASLVPFGITTVIHNGP